ncbi:MAG: transketolase [Desulfobacca sp. RBG_16_60_12]|nr:MAG: transketolase [Desulfobacca sp. RBG_16_60_12]
MSSKYSEEELKGIANRLRRRTIEMIYRAKSGHPGGSLSAADILAALYFKVLRLDPARPDWEDRDRFILSKGHAAPIYYATLMERGYFSEQVLSTYGEIDSCLQGHPDMHTPGVDMSTGSLGQGLSVAVGMALAARLKGRDLRVYALLGDGEVQEGQVWEAAMAAAKFKLDHILGIIDHNRLQVDGPVDMVMPIGPIADKWQAFNWHVLEVDGHDVGDIVRSCETAKTLKGKPTMLIAHTVKGKGVSFMEDNAAWHSRALTDAEREKALMELSFEEGRDHA